jgi:6-pyruvoyltetrahydropterin/6-carboxytetrahydropterin synthase
MYAISVRTDFIAQHFLVGGDWGAENQLHAHHYVLELQLRGEQLDQHGYLVDITLVDAELGQLRAHYRDRVLNDLPEFAGLNPSVEHFARIAWERLREPLAAETVTHMAVRLWENELASATYEAGLRPP